MSSIPPAVVARLCQYRRQLPHWIADGKTRIYSRELAELIAATPAQVRRDLMTFGFSGSSVHGYDAQDLLRSIANRMGPLPSDTMTLVGVGRLGGAVLDYLARSRPELSIPYAFDTNPDLINHDIGSTRVLHLDELERALADSPPRLGVLAVPRNAAQDVANRLVALGIPGILNFVPVVLEVPRQVHLEIVDIACALDKVLFFTRSQKTADAN